jgi:hypothetical protein
MSLCAEETVFPNGLIYLTASREEGASFAGSQSGFTNLADDEVVVLSNDFLPATARYCGHFL